ncbi:MAG: aldo/keto reductase [Candidatus Poribacteria bacterium]|nr:aldo/keto reductase [Candidatus Poribacteria bacterium]
MAETLEQRPYGRTGEPVTVIGLGGSYLDKHSLGDGVATVRRALDLGINYFDTAPAYGRGASQVILGHTLEGCTTPYLLATKLGYLATPKDFRSPDALRAQLWENLRALRRSQVDILQVHLAEWACWWKDGADNQPLSLDETYDFANAAVMQVLREAKAQGICRFISITADHAEELAHVLRHVEVDACLVAYDYTLLSRKALKTALPLAREKGVAYIAAGVIKSIGADKGESPDPRLNELQKASGLSLVTLTVRYLIADPAITTILVGAATPEELEERVVAAQAGPLPPELHQAVEKLSLP